jgi:hypothetical protein
LNKSPKRKGKIKVPIKKGNKIPKRKVLRKKGNKSPNRNWKK